MTDRRGEEERSKDPERRPAAAYQGAIEAVFAILIGAFVGNFADDHFGTAPRYLLIGFAIGFCSFVLRLVQLGRKMHGQAQDSEPDDE
jgi:F0F1-type ATP synthase assembly protein I